MHCNFRTVWLFEFLRILPFLKQFYPLYLVILELLTERHYRPMLLKEGDLD